MSSEIRSIDLVPCVQARNVSIVTYYPKAKDKEVRNFGMFFCFS